MRSVSWQNFVDTKLLSIAFCKFSECFYGIFVKIYKKLIKFIEDFLFYKVKKVVFTLSYIYLIKNKVESKQFIYGGCWKFVKTTL
ncbi:hypothetical protein [uncultured Campylobacter sp.]|uniref:hypothetical protein n=1 Tax=uncultured Campylobacter sp. TaxID=218934 RepID=UPI002632C8E8|nr:hypothetical protein [uncultured Campylobacter sp.]